MILCHERFEEERQNVREAGISRSDFLKLMIPVQDLMERMVTALQFVINFLLIIIQVFQKIERLY
ncbi:MAG: hypothetical protein HOP07_04880 [Bacteriovoracaceae bacterium]|nr:hypothetical protein [Bacteriovoracaceae bacterium]